MDCGEAGTSLLIMSDEIIKELWKIKDVIAKECGYDARALVALLQAKKRGDKDTQ
jgi:hypothetical protein